MSRRHALLAVEAATALVRQCGATHSLVLILQLRHERHGLLGDFVRHLELILLVTEVLVYDGQFLIREALLLAKRAQVMVREGLLVVGKHRLSFFLFFLF